MIRTAVSAVLFLSFAAGCTPSVRYTSALPSAQPAVQPSAQSSTQQTLSANNSNSNNIPQDDGTVQQFLSDNNNVPQDGVTVHPAPSDNGNVPQDDAWIPEPAEQSIPPVAQSSGTGKKPSPPSPSPPSTKKPTKAPASVPAPSATVKKGSVQHLEQVVKSYIGTRYKYGGMSRTGVDCSGFVTLVFKEVYGKPLPRSARDMWRVGIQVPITAARPGDLIFFKGNTFSTIDHVGIYLGNNKFAHASSSVGVTYSNVKESKYHASRLAGVRRVL